MKTAVIFIGYGGRTGRRRFRALPSGDGWQIEGLEEIPVDERKIHSLIQAVTSLNSVRDIPDGSGRRFETPLRVQIADSSELAGVMLNTYELTSPVSYPADTSAMEQWLPSFFNLTGEGKSGFYHIGGLHIKPGEQWEQVGGGAESKDAHGDGSRAVDEPEYISLPQAVGKEPCDCAEQKRKQREKSQKNPLFYVLAEGVEKGPDGVSLIPVDRFMDRMIQCCCGDSQSDPGERTEEPQDAEKDDVHTF